jgi:hypothetical protein
MTSGELGAGAQKIDGVVQLIRDIAGRTNLLAPNASIEAARVDETGKSFAVVRLRRQIAHGADRDTHRGRQRPEGLVRSPWFWSVAACRHLGLAAKPNGIVNQVIRCGAPLQPFAPLRQVAPVYKDNRSFNHLQMILQFNSV